MGMARLAVEISAGPEHKQILKASNMDNVKKAINENDLDLAIRNYESIESKLLKIIGMRSHPIHKNNIQAFRYFVQKGLDHWFNKDPFEQWCNMPEGHGNGWESFLNRTVYPQIQICVPLKKVKYSITI